MRRPTLEALRQLVAECRAEVPEGLPSALACLVGYFGTRRWDWSKACPSRRSIRSACPT